MHNNSFEEPNLPNVDENQYEDIEQEYIAVIGMACHLPGARTPESFWQNLINGVESIVDIDDGDIDEVWANKANYVKRHTPLEGVGGFDAEFFDMPEREALTTAPAHRLLLTCAQEALEDSAYVPNTYQGSIGVYVGANKCNEWQHRLRNYDADLEKESFAHQLQSYIASDLDYSATRISYKLNLTGPSLSISTACSTSMVAIHQASKALLNYDCDMALAGGACVVVNEKNGYLFENGGFLSVDGHCRSFDAEASGTVFGNGAGMVVLKRLSEALEDNDNIHVVIKGIAINNDGSAKVGYTAPSIKGQSEVIANAISLADVDPGSVGYVEAHGMGTPLGDPIEFAALSKVYAKKHSGKTCLLGSAKSNLGHLGTASGIAAFIKTALVLKNTCIPPTLHFKKPNPEMDFAKTSFKVNSKVEQLKADSQPHRAAVNSFGVGGTNAHGILEQAPEQKPLDSMKPFHLIILSAKTEPALQRMASRLGKFVTANPLVDLGDLAFTLGVGRQVYSFRTYMVVAKPEELCDNLNTIALKNVHQHTFNDIGEQPEIQSNLYDLTNLDKIHANLNKLGELWLKGGDIDFLQIYADENRKRISLPTYPFEEKHFWLPSVKNNLPVNHSANEESTKQLSNLAVVRETLRNLVISLLGKDDFDNATPLVELGISSIMAIELSTRLTQELRLADISVVTLLSEEGSINNLSEAFDSELENNRPSATDKNSEADKAIIKSNAEDIFEPFPLTDIQQAYWIGRHDVFEGGNVATYVYLEKDIENIQVEKLEVALNKMIARHPMLRTVFDDEGRQYTLSKLPKYQIKVERDLNNNGKQTLEQVRQSMSHQMMATDSWPLFEIRVTQHQDSIWRLHCGFDSLIMDGSSLQVFFRDLFLYYIDEDYRLPKLDILFRDYVLYTQITDSKSFPSAKEYWINRLATLPGAPSLPQKKTSKQITSPMFKRRQFRLSPTEWSSLQENARKRGLTDAVLVATVYSEVIAKWSQSSHFCLNLTVFDRPSVHPDINEVIGDFTSSLLLEVNFENETDFVNKSKNLQRQLLQDLEHRDFGGIKTLRAINSHLGGSATVIMPVVLTIAIGVAQYNPELLADKENHISRQYQQMMSTDYMISQSSQVWLDCMIWENDGGLLVNWDALDEIFPENVLDEMLEAFHLRLLELINFDWLALNKIPIPASQKQQRALINKVAAPTEQVLLHQQFNEQTLRVPQNIALVNGTKRMSYDDLKQLSLVYAEQLKKNGLEQGKLVAVVMQKGWEQVVAVLATLYAGGAYMPVDASLPLDRIERLIEMGEVSHVLTQESIKNRLPKFDGVKIFTVIDTDKKPEWAKNIEFDQQDTSLAYVIFTSGSTGTPKGVMIDHRGALNTINAINKMFSVTDDDSVLGVSSLSFDLSVYDIFGILSKGATLVLPEFERQYDPQHWRDLIRENHITLWNSAPQLMGLLIDDIPPADDPIRSLRTVMLSGDWIPLSLPNLIRKCNKNTEVISLGGATEASIWSIYFAINSVDKNWKSIPYGQALANQTMMVLDKSLSPCPNYVHGDIYIGGIGLTMGYWKNPTETNKRLIIHPETKERIYHTGDLGYFDSSGNIILLGRSDNQVKIQGHRIELGEIEHVLRAVDGVDEAVVLADDIGRGQKQLVAYLVPKNSSANKNQLAPAEDIDADIATIKLRLSEEASESTNVQIFFLLRQNTRIFSAGLYFYDKTLESLIFLYNDETLNTLQSTIDDDSPLSLIHISKTTQQNTKTIVDYNNTSFNASFVESDQSNTKTFSSYFSSNKDTIITLWSAQYKRNTTDGIANEKTSLIDLCLTTLKSKLPLYMVPKNLLIIDLLPLTSNGKVDTKVLLKNKPVISHEKQIAIKPRDALERKIFDIWADAIGNRTFCIDDNLYELGGTSITATQIASQVRKILDVNVPLQTFLTNPCVSGVSESIRKSAQPPLMESSYEEVPTC